MNMKYIRKVCGIILGVVILANTTGSVCAKESTAVSITAQLRTEDCTEESTTFEATMEKKYYSTSNVSNFGYWVYRPSNSEDKKLPLIVYMHGISERGNNLNALLNVSLPKYLYNGNRYVNAVVIMPQCPSGTNWTLLADDVVELIDHVSEEENIDTYTIGLTGHSLGGIGTWVLGLKYPDKFSSLVPVSGTLSRPGDADKLKDVAIWAFHGKLDSMTPASMLAAYKTITNAGGDKMQVTLFENQGHLITGLTYDNDEYPVLDWMISQHLPGYVPEDVDFEISHKVKTVEGK